MVSKSTIKQAFVILIGSLAFSASSVVLTSCELLEEADDLDAICQDVGVSCSKTPFTYKACADDNSVWWELNGKKYYDVNSATNAYFAYCGY
jgi:hypothetical protein